MDLHMPELDGLEATARIRQAEEGGARCPIVALTADASPADRERCLAAGMDDHIIKPLTGESLRRLLERWGGAGAALRPAIPQTEPAAAEGPAGTEGHPAANGEAAPPVLDRGILRRTTQGDPEIRAEVIRVFCSAGPRQVAAVREAARRRRRADLVRELHSLKGAAACVGGAELQAMAARLEKEARDGGVDAVAADLEALEPACARLQQALEELERSG
jgi:CheY-like chemotaxis protein